MFFEVMYTPKWHSSRWKDCRWCSSCHFLYVLLICVRIWPKTIVTKENPKEPEHFQVWVSLSWCCLNNTSFRSAPEFPKSVNQDRQVPNSLCIHFRRKTLNDADWEFDENQKTATFTMPTLLSTWPKLFCALSGAAVQYTTAEDNSQWPVHVITVRMPPHNQNRGAKHLSRLGEHATTRLRDCPWDQNNSQLNRLWISCGADWDFELQSPLHHNSTRDVMKNYCHRCEAILWFFCENWNQCVLYQITNQRA